MWLAPVLVPVPSLASMGFLAGTLVVKASVRTDAIVILARRAVCLC